MGDDGGVSCEGRPLPVAELRPEIAWANRDLYVEGPVTAFMVACLKSPRLRWLQSSAAGFEHPVFSKLARNGVRLTNANASAVPISEFIFARIFEAFHPIEARRRAQQAREWKRLSFRDLAGTTWLVYGLGNIGAELSVRARAFGARVIGVRRNPSGDEPVDEMVGPGALLPSLAHADVVVMTAAVNETNRGIADARFFAAMTRLEAVFVNVGRGGLVDEGALLAGLERGHPSLAILDVFEQEPLPADSRFWRHPRVWVTAHSAGASPATRARGDEIFFDNLSRYLAGRPLALTVDPLVDSRQP